MPTQDSEIELHDQARAYLHRALRDRAPADVRLESRYDESPLEGEGPAAVFSFELPAPADVAGAWDPRHYVVVGQTEPDHFPAFSLTPDEAYSFHIGGRFLLELGVMRVQPQEEPAGARAAFLELVATCNPGVPVANLRLAGLFRYGDQHLAVYRLRVGEVEVYGCGADCPPGFYGLTQHPPQVVLRLHLGNVIRHEAREEARRAEFAAHAQAARTRRAGG